MKKETILKNTTIFTKNQLAGEGTGHDWWHIERVLNNARLICKKEKVDWFVVELAVLLHDVGDRKVINKEEDDYSIARDFLKKQKVSVDIIERVMFIIENMSFSGSFNSKKEKAPPEFYIVQDADRLDAIGAVGIARVFTYSGSKGRLIHDPTKKAQKISTTEQYLKTNSSAINHFEEKLFLLKDLMNTRSARKIADKRHVYMKNYVKTFLAEWRGEM